MLNICLFPVTPSPSRKLFVIKTDKLRCQLYNDTSTWFRYLPAVLWTKHVRNIVTFSQMTVSRKFVLGESYYCGKVSKLMMTNHWRRFLSFYVYSSLYLCSHPEFSNTDTFEFLHKNVTGKINSWFIAEMFGFKGDFFHCVGLYGGLSVLVGILLKYLFWLP